jgi:FG-GAP-like repeat
VDVKHNCTREIQNYQDFGRRIFADELRLFGMLLLALPLSAFAQTYLFNQAVIETGKSPVAVVASDFNRDGQLDLAVVNQNDNTVSVILSRTDGSFASKVDYPVGASPVAIVSGDFNGDGFLDLAVVNCQDNTISILLGSATRLFSPQQTFSTGVNAKDQREFRMDRARQFRIYWPEQL